MAALRLAIETHENSEKAFRQVVEDRQNGRDVPAFLTGEAGLKIAKRSADEAYQLAEDARRVLASLEGEVKE